MNLTVAIPPSPSSDLGLISPRVFDLCLVCFNTYVIHLFKAALGDDRSAVNDLLRYPLFDGHIIEVLKTEKKTISRINVLNHIARHHINELEKQEVKDLIKAVGVSAYVTSVTPKKVSSLYRNLFSYPRSYQKRETVASETDSSLAGGPPSVHRFVLRLGSDEHVGRLIH